jgi:hypothetical protein
MTPEEGRQFEASVNRILKAYLKENLKIFIEHNEEYDQTFGGSTHEIAVIVKLGDEVLQSSEISFKGADSHD